MSGWRDGTPVTDSAKQPAWMQGAPVKELDALDKAVSAPEAPGTAAKMGRGMMDLFQGVKQLGLMASDAFTGGKDADAYTKAVGEEIANYERGRKAGGDTGFDWSRLAGNLASPATLIPGGMGGNLAARMATGAAGGAAQSGLMFTPEGESKGAQVAGGAVFGAAGPAVVEGATRAVRGVVNRGGNAIADVGRAALDPVRLESALQQITREAGMDWNALSAQARDGLKAEATRQLTAGGNLDATSLARIAAAKAVDPRLELTRGQVSRLPADWQTEQNLRGVQGVGDELRQRFGDQGRILSEAADRMRRGIGATTDRPFQAGEIAIGAVQKKFAETGDDVSALYKAARESVGAQADVPTGPLYGRAMTVLQEFDDVIPGPIKSRLEAVGIGRMGPTKATKAFTVEEAEALDKLINKRWDASNKPLTAALSELKGAIRDSLGAIDDQGGSAAAQAFRQAKQAAAGRFDEFGQKIARSAAEDVAPDKFVQKFVLGGDVRDVKALVKTLTTGTGDQVVRGEGALNAIRAATLTHLLESSGAMADGVLSGAKLDKAIKDMGLERMAAVFTPEQIGNLEALRKVSLDLTKPPPLSDINYSRTAGALANLLNTVGKVPGLGAVAKVGQAEVERGQRVASKAALAGPAITPRAPIEFVGAGAQNALAAGLAPYSVAPASAVFDRLMNPEPQKGRQ